MPKAKRKALNPKSTFSVYEFESFDSFIEYCGYLVKNTSTSTYTKLKKASLYKLNSKYYLLLNLTNIEINNFKYIHCSTVEFGKFITDSDLFQRKLTEYGTIIFKTNAIGKCVKSFLLDK